MKMTTRKKNRADCSKYCFFVAAVFMIADGHFWNGIVFIGAGTGLLSATAIYKKKDDASDKDQETI